MKKNIFLSKEQSRAWERWKLLGLYDKFEQLVVLVLTFLIALTVLLSIWNLGITVIGNTFRHGMSLDITDGHVFRKVFGMIFTVIIALEFKRSLLVTIEHRFSLIQVRTVILIAILAIVRKFIILDFTAVKADKLLALAAAILAIGIVYWLVCDTSEKNRKYLQRKNRQSPLPDKQEKKER